MIRETSHRYNKELIDNRVKRFKSSFRDLLLKYTGETDLKTLKSDLEKLFSEYGYDKVKLKVDHHTPEDIYVEPGDNVTLNAFLELKIYEKDTEQIS